MGRLADEMVDLCRKMQGMADERKQLVSELKTKSEQRSQEVMQKLADFRRERDEVNAPFLRDLQVKRQEITRSIESLKADTAQMRERFRQEQDIASRQYQNSVKRPTEDRCQEVAAKLTAWNQERSQQAVQLREQLTSFRTELTASLPDFENLSKERHAKVNALRSEVKDLQKNNRRELAAMAQEGGENRQAFVHSIRQDVAVLQRNAQTARHEMISDLVKMRQALHGELPPEQKAETSNHSFANDVGNPHRQETPTIDTSDDLTLLSGIGPVRARLLQASGIHTFLQLASSTIEDLESIVHDSGVSADIEKWITDAAKLCNLK